MSIKTLMMLTASILLVAAFASGQELIVANAKIPFAFSVAGKVLPAGEYNFVNDPINAITVSSIDKKVTAVVPIVTYLDKEMHTTPKDSHVVFDKIGNAYILAEIWVPGFDGLVLDIIKEKHTHQIINIPFINAPIDVPR